MRSEIIFGLLAAIGLVMMMTATPGGSENLAAGMTLLALTYCPFGIFHFNGIGFRKLFRGQGFQGVSFLGKVASFGIGSILSILIIGSLFKLLILPGAEEMLIIGLAGGTIAVIITLAAFLIKKSTLRGRLLGRSFVWILLAGAAYSTSGMTIIKAQYRDFPELIDAYEEAYENPDDQELWIQAEELRMKIETGD